MCVLRHPVVHPAGNVAEEADGILYRDYRCLVLHESLTEKHLVPDRLFNGQAATTLLISPLYLLGPKSAVPHLNATHLHSEFRIAERLGGR